MDQFAGVPLPNAIQKSEGQDYYEQGGVKHFIYPHKEHRSDKGVKLGWVKLTERWQGAIVTGYDVLDGMPEREVNIVAGRVVEVDLSVQRIDARIREGVLEVTDGPKGIDKLVLETTPVPGTETDNVTGAATDGATAPAKAAK